MRTLTKPRLYRRLAMPIAQVARELGLTHRAIRHYESQGLISSVRDHRNARAFEEIAVQRLRLAAQLRGLGLQLSEILDLMNDDHPQAAIHLRLTERLEAITLQGAAIRAYLAVMPGD